MSLDILPFICFKNKYKYFLKKFVCKITIGLDSNFFPRALFTIMAVADLQVLSPGDGYGIVIGLGIGFTFIMIGLTLVQNRYGSHNTFKSTE
jgi:hypothetical protein